jgi:hypothetical protein
MGVHKVRLKGVEVVFISLRVGGLRGKLVA